MVMGGSSGDLYYFLDFQRQLNDPEKKHEENEHVQITKCFNTMY
jgi:hypothetical protein